MIKKKLFKNQTKKTQIENKKNKQQQQKARQRSQGKQRRYRLKEGAAVGETVAWKWKKSGKGKRWGRGSPLPKGQQLVGEQAHPLGPEAPSGNCPSQFQTEKGRFSFIIQQCAWSLGVGSPLLGGRSVHFPFIYEFYPESGINGYETDLIFMSILKPMVDMSAF